MAKNTASTTVAQVFVQNRRLLRVCCKVLTLAPLCFKCPLYYYSPACVKTLAKNSPNYCNRDNIDAPAIASIVK